MGIIDRPFTFWVVFVVNMLVIVLFSGAVLYFGNEARAQIPDSEKCRVQFVNGSTGVGVNRRTFNGVLYCEYLGIRYAEPPVGKLRLKNPILREPNGTEKYQQLGSVCAQLNSLGSASEVLGDEDCLFMNVYSPLVPHGDGKDQRYPVLVYIHGGSYAIWSPQTDMYGVDLLVESGVLIVSFNYRLFISGFMHYTTFNVTGNFGLKDQLIALQWVQQFIEPFGGDPSNVTLMGQSVGAHSVTYHLYLEQFQGLFHRAIAMSGSLLSPSAMIYYQDEFVHEYLESLNITTYEQLMKLPFRDLFQLQTSKRRFIFATVGLPIFIPTIENPNDPDALVTQPVHELFKTEPASQVPLMIGMTAGEFIPLFSPIHHFFAHNNFPNHNNETLNKRYQDLIRKAAALVEKVEPAGVGKHFYGKLADLSNMYYPVKRLLQELRNSYTYLAPIYYYRFEYDGKFGKYKNEYYANDLDPSYQVAIHGDDLGYLFTSYNAKAALKNKRAFQTEWEVTERNVRRFSNFIKYGDPTIDMELKWPPFNGNETESQFLNINSRDEIRTDDDGPNFIYQMWHRIYECLYFFECDSMDRLIAKIDGLKIVEKVHLDEFFDDENLA
ncbi:juvenile hormone esterase-like [Uranotaenia lowii]|uniref:juvenile hormone esterase-like n=1 Tax=Uranotaenia lowii TaxID=190385 RepID=UPI00247A4DF3|nr:juvenile hormone esterase-like [Uranotaenia lowii]